MPLLGVLSGFALGLRHSLEVDHVAAVAHFASVDPRPGRGLWLGLRWGMGHSAALTLLGGVLVPFPLALGAAFTGHAEVTVGLMLIGLAVWRLYRFFSTTHEHPHRHANGVVHTHPHRHGLPHLHVHAPTVTGFVHGTVGALPVLALLPLNATPTLRVLCLMAFALGSTLSMGLFGLFAGRVYATGTEVRMERAAVLLTAGSGLALGVAWILRHLG